MFPATVNFSDGEDVPIPTLPVEPLIIILSVWLGIAVAEDKNLIAPYPPNIKSLAFLYIPTFELL